MAMATGPAQEITFHTLLGLSMAISDNIIIVHGFTACVYDFCEIMFIIITFNLIDA